MLRLLQLKKNNVIINAMRTSKGIAAFGGNQSLVAQMVKRLPVMWETWVRSLGWEDLLEKETATQPGESHGRTEEPGRLHSMGSQRVGHD